MLGLKKGTVKLESHKKDWEKNASDIITLLWSILNHAAVDIQHVGSTAIRKIHAKPIIDIVVGLRVL